MGPGYSMPSSRSRKVQGVRNRKEPARLSRIRDNVGVFVAGSRRSEFPTETERLLLQVATNQAAIALQEARIAQEERSRARAALQEVEQRFRTMADSVSDVIWIRALEPERVLYTSPSFERIWGLSVDDLCRNPPFGLTRFIRKTATA